MNSLAVLAVKGRVRFRPPKRLTPPQAGARGQSHQGTKPRRNGSGQGRDSLQRQGFYPGAHQLGQPGPSQGDDAINRSRTAALNTPARMRCTTPTGRRSELDRQLLDYDLDLTGPDRGQLARGSFLVGQGAWWAPA